MQWLETNIAALQLPTDVFTFLDISNVVLPRLPTGEAWCSTHLLCHEGAYTVRTTPSGRAVLGEILHQALRLIDGKREERGGGSAEKNVTAGSDSSVSEQGQSQGQTFPANSRTSVPNHVTIPTGVVVKVPRSAACNDSNTTPSPYQQTQSQTQLDEEGEGQEEGDFYWIENGMRRIIPDRETALLYTNKSSPSGHLRLIDLSHTNTTSSTTTTTNTT